MLRHDTQHLKATVHLLKNKLTYFCYAPELEDRGAYCFCPVCHFVILSFCNSVLLSETLTFLMNARALIFHMSIPCDKTFPWIPLFLTVTLTLEFDLLF